MSLGRRLHVRCRLLGPDDRRPRVRTLTRGPGLSLFRTTPGGGATVSLLGLPLGLPVRWTIRLTVSRSKRNFDLDQLIPLLIGAIALGNGEKFTQPTPRILGG